MPVLCFAFLVSMMYLVCMYRFCFAWPKAEMLLYRGWAKWVVHARKSSNDAAGELSAISPVNSQTDSSRCLGEMRIGFKRHTDSEIAFVKSVPEEY